MLSNNKGYKSILAIDSGINIGLKRKENQDALLSFLGEDFSLFIICDGMGGHNSGKLASEITINAIKTFIVSGFKNYNDYKLLLNDALHEANSKVFNIANSNPENKNMGSTAVVLLVVADKAFVAHSGDSRLYFLRDKKIKQITKDHSLVQELVDKGQISPEESKKHPLRNEITNVIGLENNFFADVLSQPILLKKNDLILLCSDGLYSLISDNEILSIISDSEFSKSVNNLIEISLQNGGNDNIAAIVIKIRDVIGESENILERKNEDVFAVPNLLIEEKSFLAKYKKYFFPLSVIFGVLLLTLMVVFIFKGRNYFDGNIIPDSLINTNLNGTDSKIERILYYLYSGYTLPDTIEFSVTNVLFITKSGKETIDSIKLISNLRSIPIIRIEFEGKAFIDKDINSWMYKVTFDDKNKKLISAEYKIDYMEKSNGTISITTFELLSENLSTDIITMPAADTIPVIKKENLDSLKIKKNIADSIRKSEIKKDTVRRTATPGEENKADSTKKIKKNGDTENGEKVKEKIKTEFKQDSL